jgi:hypothetical protein
VNTAVIRKTVVRRTENENICKITSNSQRLKQTTVSISSGHRRYYKIYVVRRRENETKRKIASNSQRGNTNNKREILCLNICIVLIQFCSALSPRVYLRKNIPATNAKKKLNKSISKYV